MREKFGLARLVFVLCLIAAGFATATYAVLREKTFHYWAYTYGDGVPAYRPENNCSCVVGPCAPVYEVVGEKTYSCDGSTNEWGYVDHPCATKTVSLGPLCYQ